MKMKELVLNVKWIECMGCENRIKNAVSSIEGTLKVEASHETGKVTVMMNENVSEDAIKEKIEDIGFTVVD